ncbi:dienelactone hydrolase family protein [Phenylobacterium sp.]|uniref:dienelactone hydrolase family protein n=1 Tax=Phenylobacterium sp. TaxID=1871053 RepID=UPI0025E60451|nr:dienelactone hydrolase family protein [Phenylobacterium sp.]MBX3483873.1 dienelactone hydrolase family protein [Phenylobacterium sp.]MCW5758327.1 dienelactone hydrolase family protein [Phenylobacterium sp.]
MCDDEIHVGQVRDPTVSRRSFGLLTVAAAGAATGAYAADVVEKDVEVKTPDGVSDSALIYPSGKGTWPAVVIWPDIFGLRPVMREMGRRLAAQGYVVLVPNPFYRSKKAPVVPAEFDFSKPENRQVLMGYRGAMTNEGVDRDAVAYVAFLDAQPQVNRKKKAGVQGYCMGGPLSFRTAAAVPGRIGAVGSFHGGGLTTKTPDSPHLLIPQTKAAYLVCVAQNDDKAQPDSKDILKAAFAEAKRPATVEVYPANHGWCVKGSAVYDEASAEKAWAELTTLYKANLV